MTLRLALVIDGNSSGAAKALQDVASGTRQLGATAATASASVARQAAAFTKLSEAAALTKARSDVAIGGIAPAAISAGNAIKGSAFQTANLAAQLQDIAVQMQSGTNPFQIALQQGTQINQVIGQQGVRGAVTAVGAAFTSLINPVSLATIGIIAGLGVATQFFGAITGGGQDAAEVLQREKTYIDQIAAAFPKAGQAAKEYQRQRDQLTKSQALDVGQNSVEEITRSLASQKANLAGLLRSIEDIAGSGGDMATSFRTADMALNDLSGRTRQAIQDFVDGKSTAKDLGDVLANVHYDQNLRPDARQLVQTFIEAVGQAQQLETSLGGAQSIIHDIAQTPINFGGLQGVQSAVDKLKGLTPELRTPQQQATDLYKQNIGQARTMSEALGITKAYDDAISALNQKMAAAKKTGGGPKADPYGTATASIQDRVAELKGEEQAIGLSTFASSKLSEQIKLENAARKDAIGLTPARIAEIDRESTAYANEQARLEALNQVYSEGKSFVEDLFASAKQNADQGQNAFQALGNAAVSALDKIESKALSMAADGVWDMIWGGASQGGTNGGGLGSWVSGLLGTIFGGGAGAGASAGLGIGGNGVIGGFDRGGFTGLGATSAVAGVVHGREFVVNARATSQHRPLLEAINAGRSIGYANGGYVGDGSSYSSMPASARNDNGGGFTYAPVTHIDARGSNWSEADLEAKLDERDRAIYARIPDAVDYHVRHPRRKGAN